MVWAIIIKLYQMKAVVDKKYMVRVRSGARSRDILYTMITRLRLQLSY